MAKRTLLGIIAVALLAGIVIVSYLRSQTGSQTIAFIVPALNNPFFVDLTNAAKDSLAGSSEFKLTIQGPADFTNIEQQIAIIENVITLKVAAIILDASDSRGVVPALKKAQDASVPVLAVDDTIDAVAAKAAGVRPIPHVGSDNRLGGKLAAEYIGHALNGSGEVAMLEGVVGSDVANARKQGFLEGLAEFPGLRLVASQTANYDRGQAFNVFQTILQANPALNALFAANDEMALGAIKAIPTVPMQNKIIIVGFDATPDGIAAVKSGAMSATIQQQPAKMGRIATELTIRLLKGRSIPSETLVPVELITGTNQ